MLGFYLLAPCEHYLCILVSMNDTVLRHLVASLATVICLLAFFSGYVSGEHGWWWVAAGCFVIYGGVYKFIDAGGHGGHH